MATTIDYAGDYGREASDYQTTMAATFWRENNYEYTRGL